MGVYWSEYKQRWISRLSINAKTTYLGSFTDKKEAAAAIEKRLRYT